LEVGAGAGLELKTAVEVEEDEPLVLVSDAEGTAVVDPLVELVG